MPKPRSLYNSDLRYLLSASPQRSARGVLGHTHWIAGLAILIGIGIWLGSRPDASIEPTIKDQGHKESLKSQIIQVLESRKQTLESGANPAPIDSLHDQRKPGTTIEFTELPVRDPDHPAEQSTQSPPPTQVSVRPELTFDFRASHPIPGSPTEPGIKAVVVVPLQPVPPEPSPAVDVPPTPVKNWAELEIRSGDSLARIFKRLGLDPAEAIRIAKQPEGNALSQLRTGPHLRILIDDDGGLAELLYQRSLQQVLRVWQDNGTYQFETTRRAFDVKQREVTGTITSSLYESGLRNGLSDQILHKLASIFSWQIDFASDVQPGDQYSVIYEERFLNSQKISTGPILAVDLILSGKSYQAIRHLDRSGKARYYSPDGTSLAGVFLRSPTRTGRITSGYSLRRYHPILKSWRPHRALDYKGRTGDPVLATADGKVIFSGNKGAYGKTVILKHGGKYRTLYAHLSSYGRKIRAGQWVKQGQVIGRIGSTGLSTGPHLHYELRIDNKPINPLKAKLPRAAPVAKVERTAFKSWAKTLSERLDLLTGA